MKNNNGISSGTKEGTSRFPLQQQTRSSKVARQLIVKSSKSRDKSDLMASGVPSNFDRNLKTANSIHSRRSRSRKLNKSIGTRT